MRRRRVVSVCVAMTLTGVSGVVASAATGSSCSAPGWRAFGQGNTHSFSVASGCSPITPSTVATLAPAWVVHTADSVTASPAIVDGTAFVGSWDGTFYAVDVATGAVRWTSAIDSHAPTAFGRIVSSASVVPYRDPATHRQRNVVLFGGGSSLWALDAETGTKLASIDLDPRVPALQHEQDTSDNPKVAEVESSPAVATIDGVRRIYVGIDVHNDAHVGRTGLVALRLVPAAAGHWHFEPEWKYDVETGRTYIGQDGLTVGSGEGWGCGGVWSSPAVDEQTGVVAFGTASCSYAADAFAAHENFAESMVALHADTGQLLWRYRPADDLNGSDAQIADADRDADFGASPNIFTLNGRRVVGEGRKSADYYVRDELTGAKVSVSDVGQEGNTGGFGVGGFLGTPAVDSGNGRPTRVVGATAIPVPQGAADLDPATWSVRCFDPATGAIDWIYRLAGPSYGHTSVVNGVVLVPDTTNSSLVAIDITSGLPLWEAPLIGPPSSTAAVDGSLVVLGTGTRETDLEYKAFSNDLQDAAGSVTGASPLSPLSTITAFRLVGS